MKSKSFLTRSVVFVLIWSGLHHKLIAQPDPPAIPPGSYADKAKDYFQRMNVPIIFYGKVIDQDGQSLPDVKVTLRVQQPYFDPITLAKAHYPTFERTTGNKGEFALGGVNGKDVEISSMTKTGYEPEPGVIHVYGPVGGGASEPLIFRMWKQNIKEPLVKGERTFRTVSDGTHYTLDLSNGTLTDANSTNADLTVWFKLLRQIDARNAAWECEIRMLNGGLIEETNLLSPMYIAPTFGYTNLFHVTVDETNKWNRPSGNLRFYLRLKNGPKYGRVLIDVAGYHRTKGLMQIEYAINPTGSTILK